MRERCGLVTSGSIAEGEQSVIAGNQLTQLALLIHYSIPLTDCVLSDSVCPVAACRRLLLQMLLLLLMLVHRYSRQWSVMICHATTTTTTTTARRSWSLGCG